MTIQQNNYKKSIMLFLSILPLLIISIVLVGCNNSSTTTDKNASLDSKIEYVNESLGYAITLPENVRDRVTIEKKEDTVYIVSKKITESNSGFPGIILFINPIPKSEYPNDKDIKDYIKNESPVPMTIIGETENNYICYNIATDLQYPPDNDILEKEYKDLVNKFINKGFGFRVLNVEK